MAPTASSCAELAARPHGLLEALLRRDTSTALRLLEAGVAAGQLALAGPELHFTALHAAALAGCAEAIPALVTAGAPVDAVLDMPEGSLESAGAAPLRALLSSAGCAISDYCFDLQDNDTALTVAVRAGHHRCVQQLLEAGADPAAGWESSNALHALVDWAGSALWASMLPPFLQHGVDPLAPLEPDGWGSLLSSCCPSKEAELLLVSRRSGRAAELLLDHLEQQRAAGALQLGTWQRAQQLLFGAAVYGAADGRHAALLARGIAALEQLLGVADGTGQAVPAIAQAELQETLAEVVTAMQSEALQALLVSRLPFDVRAEVGGSSLLQLAMQSATMLRADAASCVRLLVQAGAPITTRDLCDAVDWQPPATVAALLSCGVPAVDVSEPQGPDDNWSCPIHRTIHAAIHYRYTLPESEPTAAMLEALTAAGFRPAVYRHVRLPSFLHPSPDAGAFAELDPLALLDAAHPQHARLAGAVKHLRYRPARLPPPAVLERLLHLARGGGWSPAAHRLWPDSFKFAARTLLLCASVSSGGSRDAASDRRMTRATARHHPQRSPSAAACLLGGLPPGVLLHVVRLAAEPMSAWL